VPDPCLRTMSNLTLSIQIEMFLVSDSLPYCLYLCSHVMHSIRTLNPVDLHRDLLQNTRSKDSPSSPVLKNPPSQMNVLTAWCGVVHSTPSFFEVSLNFNGEGM
jgi:hypothetical protein